METFLERVRGRPLSGVHHCLGYTPLLRLIVRTRLPSSRPTHENLGTRLPSSRPTHENLGTRLPSSQPTHESLGTRLPHSHPTHESLGTRLPSSRPTHKSPGTRLPSSQNGRDSNKFLVFHTLPVPCIIPNVNRRAMEGLSPI